MFAIIKGSETADAGQLSIMQIIFFAAAEQDAATFTLKLPLSWVTLAMNILIINSGYCGRALKLPGLI